MNLLEAELLLGLLEESKGERARLMASAKLDFNWFAKELRKGVGHFTIKDERRVGIQFFLKLKELVLSTSPWASLIHRKDKQVAALVVGKGVEDGRVGDAHRAGRWLGLVHG